MKITKEAKVGLLVVVSLSILYTGFNFLKGKDYFSNDNTFYVVYDNIDGLVKSNDVEINGHRVGRVDNITLQQDKGNTLLVTLSVSTEFYIPKGTIAELSDVGPLGGKKIVLNLSSSKDFLESDAFLAAGKSGSLTDILANEVKPITMSLDSTLISFRAFMNDTSNSSLKATLSSVNSTFKEFETTAKTVSSTLRPIKPKMDRAFASLDTTMSSLKVIMSKMSNIADTLQNLELKQTIKETNDAIAGIVTTIDNLNEGKGTLGKLMTDDQVYQNLSMAVQRMNLIMYNFDTDPKQFLAPLGQSQKKIMKKRQQNDKVSGHYKEFVP